MNKDDADAVLPWNDLLSEVKEGECFFGRKTSNMDVYRRINIVLEEVTDVSRLLLPSNDQSRSSIKSLLHKYDIVSLQPMNEPTLQNICELLPSGDSTPSIPVDIIVLEYATGSRGGYGLPYRIRKDNVIKAMDAGVTFEVCYATATVDPKRRQGFMRTLTDFQTTYNSIQKKQALLNKHVNDRSLGKRCKVDQYPLLISSGSRQNYSAGTDEGVVSLRAPGDVQFLARQTTGGDGWIEKQLLEYNDSQGTTKKRIALLSAADKVLMRARDRSLGVVSCSSKNSERKRKMERSDDVIRAYVYSMGATKRFEKTTVEDNESDDDSDDGISNNFNLVEWLSVPIRKSNPVDNSEEEGFDAEVLSGLEPLSNEIAPSKDCAEQNCEDERMEDDDDDDLEDGFLAL